MGGVLLFFLREKGCVTGESLGDFGEGATTADQWRATWGLKLEGLQTGRGRGANWLDLEHVDPH
jgi:hypothetical protein